MTWSADLAGLLQGKVWLFLFGWVQADQPAFSSAGSQKELEHVRHLECIEGEAQPEPVLSPASELRQECRRCAHRSVWSRN